MVKTSLMTTLQPARLSSIDPIEGALESRRKMTLYLVTYVHPDPVGWEHYLKPHLEWIAQQVEAGTLLASGPTTVAELETRSAALLFQCEDEDTLHRTLDSDPYLVHGQVSNMTCQAWDPIFGVLNERSSRAGRSTERTVSEVLAMFGPHTIT
ncbi:MULTISPECIES: YciI family protein [Rhodococcus]|uniref:YciI family protein n=1 Tax=Rhodococcus TaxID=1827 RepID=UPI000D04F99D|nr:MULTISPECIES: YciI family protein [Rhodococcus]AYA23346.1 hypothetical protein C6369_001420 [Rhodococcus rhodochrous]MDC3729042.1 hypothetical protein [Rhodococcus sp. Rp3]WSE25311.1 YciI family protein [Rhodococcus sp. PD04]